VFTSVAFAQHKEEWVDLQIENIQSQFDTKGITEYFIFQLYTQGGTYITNKVDNKCDPSPFSTKYMFWKEGDKNWIKRISECGISSDVQLTGFKPLDFVIKHISSIENECVLHYSYKPTKQIDGKTYVYFVARNHTPQRVFNFHILNRTSTKRINTFNLTNSEDKINLHFEYNNALPMGALSSECTGIVKMLEKKGVFETIIRID